MTHFWEGKAYTCTNRAILLQNILIIGCSNEEKCWSRYLRVLRVFLKRLLSLKQV